MPTPWYMELFQILAWCAAIAAALFAVHKTVYEIRRSRKETRRERRWRQAQAAKELLDGLYADPMVRDALTMLDWPGRPFKLAPDDPEPGIPITEADWVSAVRNDDASHSPKDLFIRTRLDRLFEYFDRIGHAIDIKVVRFEDIEYALAFYYKKRLTAHRDEVEHFMKLQGFDKARSFFDRCNAASPEEDAL